MKINKLGKSEINVGKYTYKELVEGGLSRLWSHTKDNNTFAIIGSQDKDTKEDRSDELIDAVSSYSKQNSGKVGYRYLWGRYTYEDGTVGTEMSVIVFNITKEKALEIATDINQNSIIWKDKDFFGFVKSDGREEDRFTSSDKNMNFSDEDIKLFGSRLAKHKNDNQIRWFKFVMESYLGDGNSYSSIKNMSTGVRHNRTALFQLTESIKE